MRRAHCALTGLSDECTELFFQRLEHGLDRLIRVLDGQGLIIGAHCQREGDGLLALDYMVAGVHVEERAVLEVLAAGGEDALQRRGCLSESRPSP